MPAAGGIVKQRGGVVYGCYGLCIRTRGRAIVGERVRETMGRMDVSRVVRVLACAFCSSLLVLASPRPASKVMVAGRVLN